MRSSPSPLLFIPILLSLLGLAPATSHAVCDPQLLDTPLDRSGYVDCGTLIDMGPDGRMYVIAYYPANPPTAAHTDIQVFDVAGNLIDVWTLIGTTRFYELEASEAGLVSIMGLSGDSPPVRVFDLDGNLLEAWAPFLERSNDYVYTLAMDRDGYLYLNDRETIWKFAADGTPLDSWDSGFPDGANVVDVAFDSQGRILVQANGLVRVHDAGKQFLYSYPIGYGDIVLSENDESYMRYSNDVQVRDAAGNLVASWYWEAEAHPYILQPIAVRDDVLYAVEHTGCSDRRVHAFETRPSPGCGPDLALHLAPAWNGCMSPSVPTGCASLVTSGTAGDQSFYHVYVLASPVTPGTGVGNLQFSFTYDADRLWVFGWQDCAEIEYAQAGWPGPGVGNALIFDDGPPSCGGPAIVRPIGVLWVGAYEPATLGIEAHPNNSQVILGGCGETATGVALAPSQIGHVSFGLTDDGCNPCLEPCEAAPVLDVPSPGPAARPVSLEAFPNPMRAGNVMRLKVARTTPVRLTVHDVTGRLVRTLLDDVRSAGEHVVEWNRHDDDGRTVPGGTYFYRLRTELGDLSGRWTVLP